MLRRVVLEWMEKKEKEKKKAKKLRDAMRCIYPIWRGKREENDFFCFSIEKKKSGYRKRVQGREREKEAAAAAARRVH
jgi:hypothetical protein